MKSKRPAASSVDEYIAAHPPEVQKMLSLLRETIRDAAPEAEEAISYQIPTFRYHGNLVHFAAWKSHISFYPTSSGIQHFAKELSAFVVSRGTVHFPLHQPMPAGLVRRIVEFRAEENRRRAEASGGQAVTLNHSGDRAVNTPAKASVPG
jgi:uncharacterized protein YdhG (YjbR/CyaY superfamily)